MFHSISVAIADQHKDIGFLINTLRRPEPDDKIGEYGEWDKMYPDIKSFIKSNGDSSKEYTKDELNKLACHYNCLVAEDGSVWKKINACPLEQLYPWNKDKDYAEGDDRIYRVAYGEVIKEIPEDEIDMFITDSDCSCCLSREEWDEEGDGEWPFHPETEVYVFSD